MAIVVGGKIMLTRNLGAVLSVVLLSGSVRAAIVTFDEVGVQPSDFIKTSPLRNEYAGLRFSGPGPLDGGAMDWVQVDP